MSQSLRRRYFPEMPNPGDTIAFGKGNSFNQLKIKLRTVHQVEGPYVTYLEKTKDGKLEKVDFSRLPDVKQSYAWVPEVDYLAIKAKKDSLHTKVWKAPFVPTEEYKNIIEEHLKVYVLIWNQLCSSFYSEYYKKLSASNIGSKDVFNLKKYKIGETIESHAKTNVNVRYTVCQDFATSLKVGMDRLKKAYESYEYWMKRLPKLEKEIIQLESTSALSREEKNTLRKAKNAKKKGEKVVNVFPQDLRSGKFLPKTKINFLKYSGSFLVATQLNKLKKKKLRYDKKGKLQISHNNIVIGVAFNHNPVINCVPKRLLVHKGDDGKYSLVLQYDIPKATQVPANSVSSSKVLSLDIGATNYLTTTVKFTEKQKEELRQMGFYIKEILNGSLVRFSFEFKNRIENLRTQKRRIQSVGGKQEVQNRCDRKEANKYKKSLEGLALFLVENFDLIIEERLSISSMVKFNGKFLNHRWGLFREILERKVIENGKHLIKVDAKNTSRKCPKCHCDDKRNRPKGIKGKRETFKCIKCGFSAHADIVGSHNIALNAKKELTERGFSDILIEDLTSKKLISF